MVESRSFDRKSRRGIFAAILNSAVPLKVRVVLHGTSKGADAAFVLRIAKGRIIESSPARISPRRLMLRIVLAPRGRVELSTDPKGPERDAIEHPLCMALMDQAEQDATRLMLALAPLGGLFGVASLDSTEFSRCVPALSTEAIAVARRLVDRPTVVMDVLEEADAQELNTARALDELWQKRLIKVELSADAATTLTGAEAFVLPSARADDAPRGHVQPDAVRAAPQTRPGASERETLVLPRKKKSFSDDDAQPKSVAPAKDIVDVFDDIERVPGSDSSRVAKLFLIGGSLVVVVLAFSIFWTRESPPNSAEVAMASRPAPAAPAAALTRTPSIARPQSPDAGVSEDEAPPTGYSLARPPPLATPGADPRLKEAERRIASQDYDRARKLLSEVEAESPDDPILWLLFCHLETEQGRFDAAVRLARKTISLSSKNFRAHVLLGTALQFQGKIAQAHQSYRQAVALEPEHPLSAELRSIVDREPE